MILHKLAKICDEIRYLELAYEMPPHCNIDGELKASALCDKAQRENDIAKHLYQTIKEYALKDFNR